MSQIKYDWESKRISRDDMSLLSDQTKQGLVGCVRVSKRFEDFLFLVFSVDYLQINTMQLRGSLFHVALLYTSLLIYLNLDILI